MQQRTPAGRFAWLGAFAVVLFQLQIALHPQEHGFAESADSACEVCVKLDQGKHAPPVDGAARAVFSSTETGLSAKLGTFSSRSTDFYAARAPPRI